MNRIFSRPFWYGLYRFSNWALLVVGGLGFGGFLIHMSVSFVSDLPAEEDLLWATDQDVCRVMALNGQRRGHRFCLPDETSLVVDTEDVGYQQLASAVEGGQRYALSYVKTRAYLSNDPRLYNVLYGIRVDGEPVFTRKEKVTKAWLVMIGFGLLGLGCVGVGACLLWLGPKRGPEVVEAWYVVQNADREEVKRAIARLDD